MKARVLMLGLVAGVCGCGGGREAEFATAEQFGAEVLELVRANDGGGFHAALAAEVAGAFDAAELAGEFAALEAEHGELAAPAYVAAHVLADEDLGEDAPHGVEVVEVQAPMLVDGDPARGVDACLHVVREAGGWRVLDWRFEAVGGDAAE